MGRSTHKCRKQNSRLWAQHKNIGEIVRILAQDNNCLIVKPVTLVQTFPEAFSREGVIRKYLLPSRPPENVTLQLLNFIDAKMEKNDELTAPNLHRKISQKFWADVSESMWRGSTESKAESRQEHDIANLSTNQIEQNAWNFAWSTRRMGRLLTSSSQKNAPYTCKGMWRSVSTASGSILKLKGQAKHPYKVHVQAGISNQGETKILNRRILVLIQRSMHKSLGGKKRQHGRQGQ